MNKKIFESLCVCAGIFAYLVVKGIRDKQLDEQIEKDKEWFEKFENDFSRFQISEEDILRSFSKMYKFKVTWYKGSNLIKWEEKTFNSKQAAEEYRNYLKEKHPGDLVIIDMIIEAE